MVCFYYSKFIVTGRENYIWFSGRSRVTNGFLSETYSNCFHKFLEMLQLILWCFVTTKSWLQPGVMWYCKSYQLPPSHKKINWIKQSMGRWKFTAVSVFTSCHGLPYSWLSTYTLRCCNGRYLTFWRGGSGGGDDVHHLLSMYLILHRMYGNVFSWIVINTCWLCIVTTGRNKVLSFPVCLNPSAWDALWQKRWRLDFKQPSKQSKKRKSKGCSDCAALLFAPFRCGTATDRYQNGGGRTRSCWLTALHHIIQPKQCITNWQDTCQPVSTAI